MILADDRTASFYDNCEKAGIRDPAAFLASKMPMCFGYLKGCFPRGILPTDVDGEVEINGNWLRLEYKHENALRRGYLPKGQLKSFLKLTRICPFTVFYSGVSDCGEITELCIYRNGQLTKKISPCTTEEFKKLCKRWADWADSQGSACP